MIIAIIDRYLLPPELQYTPVNINYEDQAFFEHSVLSDNYQFCHVLHTFYFVLNKMNNFIIESINYSNGDED